MDRTPGIILELDLKDLGGPIEWAGPGGHPHPSTASIALPTSHLQSSSCSSVSTLTAITRSSSAMARPVLPSVAERHCRAWDAARSSPLPASCHWGFCNFTIVSAKALPMSAKVFAQPR